MRVITGSARGARLITLEGMQTRPTAERVKEAIFSMVQFEIEGRRVLDLFAGSGQLGIEALSRGARAATFVDASTDAVDVVKKNLVHTRLFSLATVITSDFEAYLIRLKTPYDLILVDPPYGMGLAAKALSLAAEAVTPNGVVVCETAREDPMPDEAGPLVLVQRKNYGKTAVHLYRHAAVKDV